MRTAYRVLAYLLALEIIIQAAAISFAVFGLGRWIQDGGVLDKATMKSESAGFTGVVGFMIHGLNGQFIVPLIGLLLLVVSFFAKVPTGVLLAGVLFLLVIVQVVLGLVGHGLPTLGLLHGLNALAVFAMALVAARKAGSSAGAAPRVRHAATV